MNAVGPMRDNSAFPRIRPDIYVVAYNYKSGQISYKHHIYLRLQLCYHRRCGDYVYSGNST
jgi:hypothetical protein